MNSEQSTARRAFLFAVTCSLFTVLGCNSTPPPTPLNQLNTQNAHGYQVFRVHCAQCHYDRSAEAFHGPGLRGVLKQQYLPSGAPANDERITATMQHGRGLMPPQPFLDTQDTADLLAYLHTL